MLSKVVEPIDDVKDIRIILAQFWFPVLLSFRNIEVDVKLVGEDIEHRMRAQGDHHLQRRIQAIRLRMESNSGVRCRTDLVVCHGLCEVEAARRRCGLRAVDGEILERRQKHSYWRRKRVDNGSRLAE